MSNVNETVKVDPLEVEVFGSGFNTVLSIGVGGGGVAAYTSVEITPKQARKLAKALRASAKLREKK